jgi:hypothetical protein
VDGGYHAMGAPVGNGQPVGATAVDS